MSESNQPVILHITKREQIILGRTLLAKQVEGKDERQKKTRAFAEFGMTWVKAIAEEPPETQIAGPDLVQVFDTFTAQGAPKQDALMAVAQRAFVLKDPFVGQYDKKPMRIEVSNVSSSWVLDRLEKATAASADDFVIADLEDRIASARRGDYKLPAELRAMEPEPTTAVSVPAAEVKAA